MLGLVVVLTTGLALAAFAQGPPNIRLHPRDVNNPEPWEVAAAQAAGGTVLAPLPEVREFAGAIWAGDVNAAFRDCSEERWQWILRQPEFKYLHFQTTLDSLAYHLGAPEYQINRRRIAEAAQAGKLVTMQFWMNHDGPFNCSYYSICNVGQLLPVRLRLFAALAECIEWYGPENLHATYLWEEVAGSNECWEICVPAQDYRNNWNGIVDGSDTGQMSRERPWLIGRDKSKFDGPYMPSARNSRDAMLAETGVDMLTADNWSPQDWQVWRRWASRGFLGETNAQWAKFLRTEYPGIRPLSWAYPAMAGDKFTDCGYERDGGCGGMMVNSYDSDGWVYTVCRAARTLYAGPQYEVHFIAHGDRPQEDMTRQAELAWRGGATSISFFSGDNNARWGECLDKAQVAIRALLPRPVMADPYPVLVVSDDYYRPTHKFLDTLGRFDVVSSQDRYAVEEGRYQQVIDLTPGPQPLWGAE